MGRGVTVVLLEGLAAVVIWGASFIATKIALREVSPLTVVWLRFAVGVAVLGATVAARRQLARVRPADLLVFALLGAVGITFHQWLQSTALVTSQASTSGWIIASAPVFIAVLGCLVLRERLSGLQAAGIALAALGVVAVVTRGDPAALLRGSFGAPGDVLIVLSSLNWAVFSVASRRVLRRHPAARVMFLVMGFGWCFTSLQLAVAGDLAEVARLTGRGWAAVAFLGVLCSGAAYVFWFDALERLPASRVGALLYLEPLVAQVVAALVLGEELHAATVAGGAVILLGVWLVTHHGDAVDDARDSAGSRG